MADDDLLGLDAPITRRDFIGATLIGSGALLLGAPAPAAAQNLTSAWNGYAGIGDYARSNGTSPRSSTRLTAFATACTKHESRKR